MISLQPEKLDHILCLGAHCDDIEIGCGATILRWLEAHPALRVTWVVFSGDERRQAEARRSAAMFLGESSKHDVRMHSFRDTLFPADYEQIKSAFRELGGSVSPDVVFTHRLEDRHQDHRVIGELTWNAFRNHLIWEYEVPKYEGDLGQPNIFVPVTKELAQQKVDRTYDAFPTQQDKGWFTKDTLWSMLRLRGVECQSPTQFAEAFHARKVVV